MASIEPLKSFFRSKIEYTKAINYEDYLQVVSGETEPDRLESSRALQTARETLNLIAGSINASMDGIASIALDPDGVRESALQRKLGSDISQTNMYLLMKEHEESFQNIARMGYAQRQKDIVRVLSHIFRLPDCDYIDSREVHDISPLVSLTTQAILSRDIKAILKELNLNDDSEVNEADAELSTDIKGMIDMLEPRFVVPDLVNLIREDNFDTLKDYLKHAREIDPLNIDDEISQWVFDELKFLSKYAPEDGEARLSSMLAMLLRFKSIPLDSKRPFITILLDLIKIGGREFNLAVLALAKINLRDDTYTKEYINGLLDILENSYIEKVLKYASSLLIRHSNKLGDLEKKRLQSIQDSHAENALAVTKVLDSINPSDNFKVPSLVADFYNPSKIQERNNISCQLAEMDANEVIPILLDQGIEKIVDLDSSTRSDLSELLVNYVPGIEADLLWTQIVHEEITDENLEIALRALVLIEVLEESIYKFDKLHGLRTIGILTKVAICPENTDLSRESAAQAKAYLRKSPLIYTDVLTGSFNHPVKI